MFYAREALHLLNRIKDCKRSNKVDVIINIALAINSLMSDERFTFNI